MIDQTNEFAPAPGMHLPTMQEQVNASLTDAFINVQERDPAIPVVAVPTTSVLAGKGAAAARRHWETRWEIMSGRERLTELTDKILKTDPEHKTAQSFVTRANSVGLPSCCACPWCVLRWLSTQHVMC